ncbi:MAG: enoyl-ACP reductase [Buchnera aphidicola (Pentalonia nigronervosa)]|jgi:enoyl-[acyl-carrier protein] reductase I|uniref:Enoyl-[acyl-carrier-protein] reductase [NADH] n=1 Tax=Buchnera aphidicola (Pentalonia nigronervosa) TaxID=1309793 RepID=A0A7H1AZQ7_9GAMM|nr:MAG: enoyl-ACP reductase [Buchnera aphidicola (Pentalonia nigronervosa)]
MGFLKNKKILITGISNSRSIAFSIAKAMYAQTAELGFMCYNDNISKKIKSLVDFMRPKFIFSCDLSQDKSIENLFFNIHKIWKTFDGLVHAVAYSPRDHLKGDFIQNTSRIGFNITHEISSYSFLGLTKACRNMLNRYSSLLTLSYLGSCKVVPNYNVMGLAKASLEANMRYMAYTLGKDDIRVNAISSGPIKTISSHQIRNFRKIKTYSESSEIIKNHTLSENIGHISAFLLSNLSNGITGSVIYVDNGVNIFSDINNL